MRESKIVLLSAVLLVDTTQHQRLKEINKEVLTATTFNYLYNTHSETENLVFFAQTNHANSAAVCITTSKQLNKSLDR